MAMRHPAVTINTIAGMTVSEGLLALARILPLYNDHPWPDGRLYPAEMTSFCEMAANTASALPFATAMLIGGEQSRDNVARYPHLVAMAGDVRDILLNFLRMFEGQMEWREASRQILQAVVRLDNNPLRKLAPGQSGPTQEIVDFLKRCFEKDMDEGDRPQT